MIINLNKELKIKLTDIMQDNYTDLDLYREKPLYFDNKKYIVAVKAVPFKEHDIFLQEMARLIFEHYEIFISLDFLNSYNYKDAKAVNTLMEKVGIFTAEQRYTHFKKDAFKFMTKWTFVSKKKAVLNFKRNKRLSKKCLKKIEPSEFIYILFLLFVYNFDIVKKNSIEFLKMFRGGIEIENQTMEKSSSGISKKVIAMPKFSPKPFSKSTLNLLEEQSKL
jgi:hypothetical protein